MVFSTDEGLHISGGVQHSQETGKGHVREKKFVGVEGVETEETLAHVNKTLSNSSYKEHVCSVRSRVVGSEGSEVSRQLGVVSSRTNQTECED